MPLIDAWFSSDAQGQEGRRLGPLGMPDGHRLGAYFLKKPQPWRGRETLVSPLQAACRCIVAVILVLGIATQRNGCQ